MEVAGYTKTFSLDQGSVLGNDQLFQALYNAPLTDGKREGICTGLSMIWLARRMMFHNESAEQRFAALFTGAAFRWGGKTQDIHVASGGGSGSYYDMLQTMYGDALRAYALRVVPASCNATFDGTPSVLGQAGATASKSAGTYCLWNIGLQTPTGSAGHMVATYASHGTLGMNRHLYFFDPNMGEYRIGTGDAVDFFTKVFEAYAGMFGGLNYLATFEVDR
ncbi:hypothetical protein GXW74_11935 [Roseomonas eburnea]|uniref:Peptidase C58 YopT-type domain-containing protein n=1 Tax=Neoroseomonas eburnea TaxID=1346889 RepID=A0A9X9XBW0_9PROT|nr:hypothetical protein [Neoroseomonas eburnea]MBR0681196.1 hypothetical protein [Neoroseomonas eburnea]